MGTTTLLRKWAQSLVVYVRPMHASFNRKACRRTYSHANKRRHATQGCVRCSRWCGLTAHCVCKTRHVVGIQIEIWLHASSWMARRVPQTVRICVYNMEFTAYICAYISIYMCIYIYIYSFIAIYCITLHYITLHYITLSYSTSCNTIPNYTAMHYTTYINIHN